MSRPWIPALTLAAACGGPPPNAPVARVTIPERATFAAVRDSLAAHELLAHPRWFTLVARIRGDDRDVQAGIYDIPRGASATHILGMLTSGAEAMTRLTIPEGLTVTEIADLIGERMAIPPESIIAAAFDTTLVRMVSPTGASLEGYLFPETYTVRASIRPRSLVRTMAEAFEQHWEPAWNTRLAELGLTRDQLVTLASIVEGEARHDAERPVIAGVYLNRLQRGMRLQADPTVQYGIQLATGKRKSRLFLKDYQFDSPYNTYLVDGLPPGPIDSPGRASLLAALMPAEVPYLYFVADTGGWHKFSTSYREHLNAINQRRR
jgi:UPF0755 protein